MVWNLLRSKNLFVCDCFLHSCSVYQSVLGSVTLCNYRHNSKDVTICMYGCTFLGFQTDGIVDWLVADHCIRRNITVRDGPFSLRSVTGMSRIIRASIS